MDNKTYQKKYRKSKQQEGWKYFSVIVPPSFYKELKKFYLKWKLDNLDDEKQENKKTILFDSKTNEVIK